jgi:biotin transport system ATP-binding protein
MQLRRALRLHPGAIIHISHDPEDIADCDQCLWLDEARVIRAGDGPEVTRAYLDAMAEKGAGDDLSDLAG